MVHRLSYMGFPEDDDEDDTQHEGQAEMNNALRE